MEEQIKVLNQACSRCKIPTVEGFGTVCILCPVHQQREKLVEEVMIRKAEEELNR